MGKLLAAPLAMPSMTSDIDKRWSSGGPFNHSFGHIAGQMLPTQSPRRRVRHEIGFSFRTEW
jgi:hypothetical protein